MKCWLLASEVTTLVLAASPSEVVEERSGYELWGMRPRHVAVVNPVTGEDPKWTLSLNGEWEFCAHEHKAERRASWGAMFAHEDNWGETRKIRVPSTPTSTDFTLKVPLKNFRAWSPEHPNFYTAKVELVENGAVVQTRRERFVVRKFELRGSDFYLNGSPFFVRGIGYHNIQPVWDPGRIADRDYRRFEVKRMREAGFNFLRTHTRCETPEFFETCDELGMMVQPELPEAKALIDGLIEAALSSFDSI